MLTAFDGPSRTAAILWGSRRGRRRDNAPGSGLGVLFRGHLCLDGKKVDFWPNADRVMGADFVNLVWPLCALSNTDRQQHKYRFSIAVHHACLPD